MKYIHKPPLSQERHTALQDELSRCDAYFARLAKELDPDGRKHQGTIIYHLRRYISSLKYDLEQQQLPPGERGKG